MAAITPILSLSGGNKSFNPSQFVERKLAHRILFVLTRRTTSVSYNWSSKSDFTAAIIGSTSLSVPGRHPKSLCPIEGHTLI